MSEHKTHRKLSKRISSLVIDIPKKKTLRPPCYGADTLITVMNKSTMRIERVFVRDLSIDIHLVYSIDKNNYIPLVRIDKLGVAKRMMLLKKAGENRSPVKIKPMPRYVLVTADPEFIMVSGIAVQTKSIHEIDAYLSSRPHKPVDVRDDRRS
jgi:hypothetical protein